MTLWVSCLRLPRRHRAFRLYPNHFITPGPTSGVIQRYSPRAVICFALQMASRSPTAVTPLPKSSAAPESPSKDTATSPQTVPFPSPQTFEIVPPLHGILLRLLSQKVTSNEPSGTTGAAPGAPADAQSQGQQEAPSTISGGENTNGAPSQATAEAPVLDPNSQPPLDIKDLPRAASSVKIRIQKARGIVEGLPDATRSIEEQQREIDELEDRVARLRSVIADFGSRAGMDRAQLGAF